MWCKCTQDATALLSGLAQESSVDDEAKSVLVSVQGSGDLVVGDAGHGGPSWKLDDVTLLLANWPWGDSTIRLARV